MRVKLNRKSSRNEKENFNANFWDNFKIIRGKYLSHWANIIGKINEISEEKFD